MIIKSEIMRSYIHVIWTISTVPFRGISDFHPYLKFTIEKEVNGELAFLDMNIIRTEEMLSSTWCTKPTGTGFCVPLNLKWSLVTGLIYRIYHVCSSWKNLNESLTKAKWILNKSQYLKSFYESPIHRSLEKITTRPEKPEEDEKVTHKLFQVPRSGYWGLHENFEANQCPLYSYSHT